MSVGAPPAMLELPPSELGEALSSLRLCSPQAQQEMQISLTRLGQLTAVQAYRVGARVELFDGLKRLRAARELTWPKLRVELHALDAVGAKVRLLRCNAPGGLSELEEAWLVRALYRTDRLSQPQIAVLLGRHKSWVCRRLTLAEGLSDELTAQVRLGLVSPTAAVAVGRLQRCNQDAVSRVVSRHGLTTRQTTRLVERLLAAPPDQSPALLEQAGAPAAAAAAPRSVAARRTPGEQLVADAFALRRVAVRLHARLLERALTTLGAPACAVVVRELTELYAALRALGTTLDARLSDPGVRDGAG